MKCVPVHHGIPAVLNRDEPWLHRHSENGALNLLSNLTGATIKGKNMLPMGRIFFPLIGRRFFPLIVAPLRRGLLHVETYFTIQKLIFDDTDTSILKPAGVTEC